MQNSSRTSFYRKYLFKNSSWSSTETCLKRGKKKSDFDKDPVLERFKFQLDNSKIKTINTLKPDFSWACTNIDSILNNFSLKKFILIFPFCSPQLSHKKWPYYNDLIKIIKDSFKDIKIVVAPGPNEIDEVKKIDAISITDNGNALNIMQLSSLIKNSSFIIANDTGPAHMSAHLGSFGLVIFGFHTTPKKVSIETEKFKSISVDNLRNLSAKKVFGEIENKLKSVLN